MSGPSAQSDARVTCGVVFLVGFVVLVMFFADDILVLTITFVHEGAAWLRDFMPGPTLPIVEVPEVRA